MSWKKNCRAIGGAPCSLYDRCKRLESCDAARAGRRVFVVQQPAVFCRTTRKFIPKYDLSPAAQHGQLVFILGPGNIFRDRLAQATQQIAKVLETFSEHDSILAVGDPVAIAAAVLIAGERTGGKIRLLKWDRMSSAYESFKIEVSDV